jgi:hypothetical protein
MTSAQRHRYEAAWLLAVVSSQEQPLTIAEAARDLGVTQPAAQVLARRELCRSLDAGNWREQRAEAEARLRTKGAGERRERVTK